MKPKFISAILTSLILIVRDPCAENSGIANDAMISWVDITPTILDYAEVDSPTYERNIDQVVLKNYFPESHGLHGRPFRPILEETNPEGWDEVYASHTFHEIHMYYPMRVVRDREYKLIWNINYGRSYPNASDLQTSSTWQYVEGQNSDNVDPSPGRMTPSGQSNVSGSEVEFGVRTVDSYLHRPEFELYDIRKDPFEAKNLAGDSDYAEVLEEYIERIRDFQMDTGDPWYIHWVYEDGPSHFFEE